ncbi:hypothetical protein MMC08_005204 [Hypocenomyce scalaris]|nr:hypothetical protein [Hypocenomyce scalaris]
MEETNYHRAPANSPSSTSIAETQPSSTAEGPLHSTSIKETRDVAIVGTTGSLEKSNGPNRYHSRKTYLQKLVLFRNPDLHQPNRLGGMVLRPLIFLSFPVIFYAGFSYGSSLVWFNVLNGTASLVLGGAPYNFTSSMVGLSYLSPLLGVIVGSLYTGRVGDWLVMRMARRNRGIMEPEHRLWMFVPSIFLISGGLILWGVGAAHGVQWFGLVFAMGVIATANTIGLQVSVAYCIDSYPELSGEALVTVILIRNTMSFAIGYGYVLSPETGIGASVSETPR